MSLSMRNLSVLFLTIFGIYLGGGALTVHADENDPEELIPSDEVVEGTIAHHNIIEVRNFLLRASEYDDGAMPIAMIIQKQLEDKDIHVHDTKDIFGEYNAEARTYRTTRQSFRADRILPERTLDLYAQSGRDFAAGFRLINVVVHEAQHYKDYNSLPIGTSPELQAYQRGYQTLLDFYWHYLLAEALVAEQRNTIEKDPSRIRLAVFAIEFARELNSYLVDEYGELGTFKAPQAFKGCVRDLSRREIALMLRDFSNLLSNSGKVTESLEILEKKMRYSYPPNQPTTSCLTTIVDSGQLNMNLPVGFSGPRNAQVIYTVNLPAKHTLVVTKEQAGADIQAHMGEVFVENGLNKLKTFGYLYSWQDSGAAYFENGGVKHIIMSTTSEVIGPINYSLKFKARFVNENNQTIEFDIGSNLLTVAQNAEFGFYPIHEAFSPVLFSNRSVGSANGLSRHEGIEFEAQSGDYLRLNLPAFEGGETRDATLYRVLDTVDEKGLPTLQNVLTIWDWIQVANYQFTDTGKYLILISRRNDYVDNLRFNFGFQLSRNGTTPPTAVRFRRLNLTDLAGYGFHPPSVETAEVKYLSRNASGYFGHFKFQSILKLDTKIGDRIQFDDLGDGLNRTVHLARLENNQFFYEQTVYSWYSQTTFHITKAEPYYLIFGYNDELNEDATSTVQLMRWRHSKVGPTEARIGFMSNDDQVQFGFFPIRRDKLVFNLDANSPVSFFYTGHHFRLYEITIPTNNSRFHLNSPVPRLARRFVLYKVDEAAFQAGQNSLESVAYTWPWYDTLDFQPPEAGRYILLVEAEHKDIVGDVPVMMTWSQIGQTPKDIVMRAMTAAEMNNQAYRAKP